MGGGDLNMKKHFHPLTMENLERVWKAEEKKRIEEERIQQLQQELYAERQKEVFEQQAIETGLKKKKKEKLDWMYQGQQAVDTDAYLLGRKIDKHVDVGKEEKPGLSSGAIAVQKTTLPKASDVLAKIKEDPLFLIKKKEEDNRKTLLANPIKLRKMKELIQGQASSMRHDKKQKKSKKKKREASSSSSESSEEEDVVHVRRKRERQRCSPSARSRSPSPGSSHKSNNRYNERSRLHKQYNKQSDNKRINHHNDDDYEGNDRRRESGRERLGHNSREDGRGESGKERFAHNSRENGRDGRREPEPKRYHNDRTKRHRSSSSSEEDEELVAQRNAMMNNAKWRQEQRSKNSKKYQIEKDAEEKHVETMLKKSSSSEEKAYFVRKMQKESFSATGVSVEDRIHRNIHSKQRTNAAIEKRFTAR